MTNLKELFELRRRTQDKIEKLQGRVEDRREMIIRLFKTTHNREPTEEEIKKDWDYLDRVRKIMSEKEIIPITGPYEDKKE